MNLSDLALTFVDSCCYVCPGLSMRAKELWEAFKDWSQESNLRQIRRRDFLERLSLYWKVSGSPQELPGLRLKPEDEWEFWEPHELRKVYLIANDKHVKIGISVDPRTRMEMLQVGSSAELTLLSSYPGSFEEEARLHVLFAKKRIRGEWFALSAEDVEGIMRASVGE